MMWELICVRLITATPKELKHLSVFKEYVLIDPSISTHYKKKAVY